MVKQIDVKTPSARGAVTLYEVRHSDIKTKQKYEESYKGNDMLNDVVLVRKQVQYLYPDGKFHVFMDTNEYSQYIIEGDAIKDELVWITDGMEGIVAYFQFQRETGRLDYIWRGMIKLCTTLD